MCRGSTLEKSVISWAAAPEPEGRRTPLADHLTLLTANVAALGCRMDVPCGDHPGRNSDLGNIGKSPECVGNHPKLGRIPALPCGQRAETAAKRTFNGEQKTILEAYFIGSKLNLGNKSLDEVTTGAKSILARLTPGENNAPPMDILPGIKADGDIQDLSAAIAAYDAKNQAQTGQQTVAAGTLESIQAQVTQLIALRHDLQLAADQAFPWRKDGVLTIRKDFLLPVDRSLNE